MSIYNFLKLTIRCPHCDITSEMEADFRFGLRNLDTYHLGDRFRWTGDGVCTPRKRPEGGDYTGDAYTECPHCHRDFWLIVKVRNDIIESAEVDSTRKGYIL
jgi:hypothetical protein